MSERLPASLEVAALRRRVEAAGGHAMLLHKGDDRAGILLLLLLERGRVMQLLERQPSVSGAYRWAPTGPSENGDDVAFSAYIAKRRRVDPDLWALELDSDDAAALAAALIADS